MDGLLIFIVLVDHKTVNLLSQAWRQHRELEVSFHLHPWHLLRHRATDLLLRPHTGKHSGNFNRSLRVY